MRVDIVPDDGPPKRAVAEIIDASDSDLDYELRQLNRQVPFRPTGELDLDEVKRWAKQDEADYLIVVTETPRRIGSTPKIAGIYLDEGLAIVSMPALGIINVQRNLEKILHAVIVILRQGEASAELKSQVRPFQVGHGRTKSETSLFIFAPKWLPGRLTLVLGMVKMNEPFKSLPKLSGAFAAAAATSAFGVFYSSIWQMADALHTLRLGGIAIAVILLMTAWLIASNQLWNLGRRYGSITESAMYNAAVVVTLLMSVTLLYLTLYAGILLTALIVIEAEYMSSVLGEEAKLSNYLDIAWLAASMGTVAGALGSNFDREDHIKTLTHGRREALRMKERGEE